MTTLGKWDARQPAQTPRRKLPSDARSGGRLPELFCAIAAACALATSCAYGADDDLTILGRLPSSDASSDDWSWAARKMADKQSREGIRAALQKRREFPRADLVALLSDEHLAVRLGALELLEEAAGDGYGFNAWASPTGEVEGEGADPRNEHALEVWRNWAGQTGEVKGAGPVLSEEQMQSYIRDIISENEDRRTRAVRMLEPHGMKGVAEIEAFIVGKPGLPESSRVSLKEAQYHLVLARTAGEGAASLARDLTRGNRDQQLGGISGLKRSGFLAIPIVRDFLGSKDALVRETAVDAILSLGGSQTVSVVEPYLKEEKDVNVIHAAMRRFSEIGGPEVESIIVRYLDHEDEDLVIAALQSITKLSGEDDDTFSGLDFGSKPKATAPPAETTAKIVELLEDPRWRVRSAALEYVSARRVGEASARVIELLQDEDEFVRSNAIKAVVAIRLTDAQDSLVELFMNDDDMVAPVAGAFTSMGRNLPPEQMAHLDSRPPDVIVGAIHALDGDESFALKNVARYAAHENLDIACAALRVLGDDEEKFENEFVANYITAALQSGNEEMITAVLDTLDLPTTSSADLSLRRILGSQNREETALDPLYDAFLEPLRKKQEMAEQEGAADDPSEPAGPGASGGLEALLALLAELGQNWDQPETAFRASLVLAKSGDTRGLDLLAGRVDKLSVSERAAIADGLYYMRSKQALPLIRVLLQDDIPNVRQETASSALYDDGAVVLIELVLGELGTEGTKLSASELYSYNLEEVAGDRRSMRLVNRWCKRMLAEEGTPDETKILALIMMRQAMSFSDVPLLEPFTSSADQWQRRAAWYSLGSARASWLAENVDRLVDDPSPRVREVLPWVVGSLPGSWTHYFSDNMPFPDRSSTSSRRASATDPLSDALRKLAESDPSPEVRFESWFALLSLGKPIDLSAFIKLMPQQAPESKVALRLAEYIGENYKRMGQGMTALLNLADTKAIPRKKLPAVLAHFAEGRQGEDFTSFAALASADEVTGEPQLVEPDVDPAEMAAKRQRLVVVVFHKPGCDQCEKVDRYLEGMKEDFPLMELDRRNILDQQDLLLNRALCDRFRIDGAGKTPSLFTQAGAKISPDTKPEAIAKLLQQTMEMPDDPTWNEFATEEIADAEVEVKESFANLTLPIVIGGGLLDGINPCAFATIIFFLSYLQIARRSPREILMVGLAFIAAVFIAYFSVGLLFHTLVEKLNESDGYWLVRRSMTYLFAAFAMLVALLSLRDAIRARQGRITDMTLQLPGFLKKRIRSVIRKGAKARNFVFAAFASGIVISFLELACTGQVYIPIVYQIQQGAPDAVLYLLIYNLAFILPLVVIFVLAFFGMTSDALIQFQQKHTAAVKFATAILFFILAAVILFGDRLLPHG